MRIEGFESGVLYAFVIAVGVVPYWSIANRLVGGGPAFGSYLLLAAVMYVSFLSPSVNVGARIGVLMGFMSVPVAVLATSPLEMAIGAALVVGFGRWQLMRWGPHLARLSLEVALGTIAISMVPLFIREGSATQLALALWGFFLMQSVFFLFERWLWGLESDRARVH